MAKFDTLAEVQRQCTFVAADEDDPKHYSECYFAAVQVGGPINVLQRDGGDFFIKSNVDETYVVVNDCGQSSLYKLIV